MIARRASKSLFNLYSHPPVFLKIRFLLSWNMMVSLYVVIVFQGFTVTMKYIKTVKS